MLLSTTRRPCHRQEVRSLVRFLLPRLPLTLILAHVANPCPPARHASLLPTILRAVSYPAAPLEGRPLNFGVVIPGLYRSSYPKPQDYEYLKSLELKTVVYVATCCDCPSMASR